MNALAKVALLATATVAVTAPAYAATSFTGNGAAIISGGNGSFKDENIPAGAFTDIIDIVYPSAGTATISTIYFKTLSNIASLTGSLNGSSLTFQSVTIGPVTTVVGSLQSVITAPGTYTLTLTGNSTGNGSYSGVASFAAVPEPATWALMIGGLALTGSMLRRRRNAEAPALA